MDGVADLEKQLLSCRLHDNDNHNAEEDWEKVQNEMRSKVICKDVLNWLKDGSIRYVGGTDLSCVKDSAEKACAALVVCEYPSLEIVYQDITMISLTSDYKAGYLAFREAPPLRDAIERLHLSAPKYLPQMILVDGNGLLHPREFGLASHLGVLCDIPTIGVAKNLHHVEGLSRDDEHKNQISNLKWRGDMFPLKTSSGKVLGMAVKTAAAAKRPVYVSIGHKVSLDTAVQIVLKCSKHKNPEPIRQADILSREYIRKLEDHR